MVGAFWMAGERQRQTFSLLTVTRIRPRRIVTGELAASLAAALGPVLASWLGVFGVALALGVVTPVQALAVITITLVVAVTAGAVGIGASAWAARPLAALTVVAAVLIAYIWVSLTMIGAGGPRDDIEAVRRIVYDPRLAAGGELPGGLHVWQAWLLLTAGDAAPAPLPLTPRAGPPPPPTPPPPGAP